MIVLVAKGSETQRAELVVEKNGIKRKGMMAAVVDSYTPKRIIFRMAECMDMLSPDCKKWP